VPRVEGRDVGRAEQRIEFGLDPLPLVLPFAQCLEDRDQIATARADRVGKARDLGGERGEPVDEDAVTGCAVLRGLSQQRRGFLEGPGDHLRVEDLRSERVEHRAIRHGHRGKQRVRAHGGPALVEAPTRVHEETPR
jgi:hypothetical protein